MLPSVVPSQLGSSSSEVGSQSCVSHGAQGLLFRIQLPEQSVHLCLLPHTTLVARRIPPRLSQKLLMPFAVGAVCSTSARVMQGQADHGPVATSAPRAVPFPPAFSLPQSQHYGLPLRPLEPPPQGFAPLYPQPRPDGKRIRPRKGKSAQERRRRSSKNAATKPGLNSMLKANRQRTRKHFPRLAETPKNLTHGVPCDVSHLAISEALKPGGAHIPDMFSPAATPASTRHSRDPDNDINFFGTNIGLVQDYSSESATDAIASDEEEEENGAVRDAAYVFSLEQENDSLKQINLNLREELSILRQQIEEQKQSMISAVPESSQEAVGEEEERAC